MRFTTLLPGAFRIDVEPHGDDRGLFARTFCADEFAAHGLPRSFVQCSTSYNARRGTLRGLHWQAAPQEEAKLVRCTRGRAFDVIVDLRPQSPTYRRSASAELSQDNRTAIFAPEGFAHGFQTLEDDTEILYQMTAFYAPELARGARWDDPAFAIAWPLAQPILSPRDASFPPFAPVAAR
jgi:dTDP-4-dehydrorhamnose 3,5-epimerase